MGKAVLLTRNLKQFEVLFLETLILPLKLHSLCLEIVLLFLDSFQNRERIFSEKQDPHVETEKHDSQQDQQNAVKRKAEPAVISAAPDLFSFLHFFRSQKSSPPRYSNSPSSSSMESKRLYLAIRSLRAVEPVLISPVLRATAKSAMKLSSLSPDRWLMTQV